MMQVHHIYHVLYFYVYFTSNVTADLIGGTHLWPRCWGPLI